MWEGTFDNTNVAFHSLILRIVKDGFLVSWQHDSVPLSINNETKLRNSFAETTPPAAIVSCLGGRGAGDTQQPGASD